MAFWNDPENLRQPQFPRGFSPKAGEGPLHADSVKCPSCASNIFFEPEIKAMLCRNCGGVFGPGDMEPRGSFGINKEHDYINDEDVSEDDKKRHEIVCNSCGATLVADGNTMSTMCPFCGSPALITKRMTREFKPDYIVPFKIDKDRARTIMTGWLSERKYTPRGFRSKSRVAKMTALYVPFWLLDCCVNTELSGTGKSNGMPCEVNSQITYYVKGIPFDASRNIANKLMRAVEPFDYSEMVKFESRYLQGFYADKYDQLPTDMTDQMMKRVEKYSEYANKIVAGKYREYQPSHEKDYTYMTEISVKYCLLPVWFMTVEFGGRQYYFAVNGQTGEASGQVPTADSADLFDWLVAKTNEKAVMTPAFILFTFFTLALVAMVFVLVSGVATWKTVLLTLLCIGEAAVILFYIAVFILRTAHKHLSSRKGQTAYEINDYDKEPDLEAYFDTTKKSDIKCNEIMVHFAHLMTNDNGEMAKGRQVD